MAEEEKDEKISVSRKEYDALRAKSMSKEETKLREIIRDELGKALGDIFHFGEEGEVGDEGEEGSLAAGFRKLVGL